MSDMSASIVEMILAVVFGIYVFRMVKRGRDEDGDGKSDSED